MPFMKECTTGSIDEQLQEIRPTFMTLQNKPHLKGKPGRRLMTERAIIELSTKHKNGIHPRLS
jgi:hypothetical protein